MIRVRSRLRYLLGPRHARDLPPLITPASMIRTVRPRFTPFTLGTHEDLIPSLRSVVIPVSRSEHTAGNGRPRHFRPPFMTMNLYLTRFALPTIDVISWLQVPNVHTEHFHYAKNRLLERPRRYGLIFFCRLY